MKTQNKIIKELLDKKVDLPIPFDFSTYKLGLSDMLEELNKLPLQDLKHLFPKALSEITKDLEKISEYISVDIKSNNFSENCAIEEYVEFAEKYQNFGWICTDPDNKQFGKKLSDGHYLFKELDPNAAEYEDRWIEFDILISHYDEEKVNNHISSYYKSIDEVKELYGEDWEWIVAECIFEQESGLY